MEDLEEGARANRTPSNQTESKDKEWEGEAEAEECGMEAPEPT